MSTSPQQALPASLRTNPSLDDWIRIETDGTVTICTGKVEIGQGIRTALAQIGAEELDVALERVRVTMADTGGAHHMADTGGAPHPWNQHDGVAHQGWYAPHPTGSPDEGTTAGSNSIQASGSAIRQAAADARHALLEMAAAEWNVPHAGLTVRDGTITHAASGRQTSYWELMGGRRFERPVTGVGVPKPPAEYTIVGTPAPRLDLPGKVTGQPCFVQDIELPGMVHGRVVRPPSYGARLEGVHEGAVASMPGVIAVVRDGNFLGVIAEREEVAARAAEQLRERAVWQRAEPLPTQEEIYERLLHGPQQALLVEEGVPGDAAIPRVAAPADAAHTLRATYRRPYTMHASLGPSAAIALFDGDGLTVWAHSQGVYALRASLAAVLDLADEQVRAIHVEGPGCYGHNGADDVALDAALLANAVPGRPVLLQWTRGDEHAWEPYGPAMVMEMQASVDPSGTVIDWNHDVHSYTHIGRPRPPQGDSPPVSNLLAAWHLAASTPPPVPQPGRGYHGGIHRNADPLYSFARRRIVKHFVPDSPLRVSALRSLGAYGNVFAIESFMDELAHAAGIDPLAFRLRHLSDERARAVLSAAAERAGWQPRTEPSRSGRGRGLAFAQYKNEKSYAAVVVDLHVDRQTGHIGLEHVVIAADAGQIINPDGLSNQLEGGVVQAASWTLKESVGFDADGITSVDWESYPILTFADAPTVETVLLETPGDPSLGAGEATHGPTAAAIANAVFDATGVRLRQVPFTRERVLAHLADGAPSGG